MTMGDRFVQDRWQMMVDNEWMDAEGGGWRQTRNPATGQVLAEVPEGTASDIDRAVSAARAAFAGGKWARLGGARRGALMNALGSLMREHLDDLATLEARDNGKAISSVKAEIHQGISEFEFFAGAASKIQGTTNETPYGFLNYTVREPLGVCGLIVPWNYPLMLTLRKMGPALAAGNAVVLKPAEETPLSALAMAQLAVEAGFPPGAINVVTGDGPGAGAPLAAHPDVDKISFTGSTEVGREILGAARQDFRRVTLELGGKSPALVFDDADLSAAVPGAVWSIFYSAGQSCEARSRILVQSSIHDEFVDAFVEATERLNVGDPMDPSTHVGALIGPEHQERVEGYIQDGVDQGARIAVGGRRPKGAPEGGSFLAPTALVGCRNDMRVAQEEIFGPVATIIPFEDEREAIRLANDVIYGLAATVWTSDLARGHRVADGIRSGVVTINQPFTVFPGTPFGGYKQSGWGREASLDALNDFTEVKSVLAYMGGRPIDPFGLGK